MAENLLTEDKSTFNMGLSILYRLDYELTIIAQCSMDSKFPEWAEALFTLSREVRFLMNVEQKEKSDSFFITLYQLSMEFKQLMHYDSNKDRYYMPNGIPYDNYGTFYWNLIEFDTFLRGFLQEKDMLLFKKENVRTSIAQMS
jgi:hypothetical protein